MLYIIICCIHTVSSVHLFLVRNIYLFTVIYCIITVLYLYFYCFHVLYCFYICIVFVHVLHWGQGGYTLFQHELGNNNTVFFVFANMYIFCQQKHKTMDISHTLFVIFEWPLERPFFLS